MMLHVVMTIHGPLWICIRDWSSSSLYGNLQGSPRRHDKATSVLRYWYLVYWGGITLHWMQISKETCTLKKKYQKSIVSFMTNGVPVCTPNMLEYGFQVFSIRQCLAWLILSNSGLKFQMSKVWALLPISFSQLWHPSHCSFQIYILDCAKRTYPTEPKAR